MGGWTRRSFLPGGGWQADREVTFLEASRFAQENGLIFLETSARTGENVEETFLKCARTILSQIENGTAARRCGARGGPPADPPRAGQLDPEKMGSGIQYGDSSLRKLARPAESKGGCAC